MHFLVNNITKTILLLILIFFSSSCNNTDGGNTGKEVKGGKEELTTEELKKEAGVNYRTDNYAEAISFYNRLIQQDSLTGEYFYKRAYCLSQLNNHQAAVKDYLKSAELNYRVYDSYYSLGVIYYIVLLDDSLAIHYFERALEKRPNSEEVKKMLESLKNRNKKDTSNDFI